MGAATSGHDPGRAADRRRRSHLRLRRLPGGLPADRSARAPTSGAARRRPLRERRGAGVGRRARPARRRRRDAAAPARALVHRRARSSMAAPQRPRRARQHRRWPATRARGRRWRDTATATTSCSPSTPAGRARGSVSGSTLREAPAGDERLPAEDRRDPVGAVGVVAAAAPGLLRGAHQPVRRGGRVRRRPAVSRRARPRADAAAASADGAPDQRPGRRDRCIARRARPGGAARARRAVAGSAVRRRAARRRGHRAGPACRAPGRRSAPCSAVPATSCRRGSTPHARRSAPPADRCR